MTESDGEYPVRPIREHPFERDPSPMNYIKFLIDQVTANEDRELTNGQSRVDLIRGRIQNEIDRRLHGATYDLSAAVLWVTLHLMIQVCDGELQEDMQHMINKAREMELQRIGAENIRRNWKQIIRREPVPRNVLEHAITLLEEETRLLPKLRELREFIS